MKIKFTLRRPGGSSVDLVAQVDGTATVGDLAGFLVILDPQTRDNGTGDWTVTRASDGYQFDRNALVTECALTSGAVIGLAAGSNRYASAAAKGRAGFSPSPVGIQPGFGPIPVHQVADSASGYFGQTHYVQSTCLNPADEHGLDKFNGRV